MPDMTPNPVPVFNPSGDLVNIPQEQFQDATQNQGYLEASPEDVQKYQNEQTYGTPGQEALTTLEGAGNVLTLGTLPAIETGLNYTTNKDIQGRRETNPGLHMLGEAAPLFIPGVGEGLGAAGEGVVQGLGITSKIGSQAVKSATENILFQSQDEVAKMLSDAPGYSNPGEAAETAAINLGLSGLIGGGVGAGLGVVSPLWKTNGAPQVSRVLQMLQDHVGGIEGQTSDAVQQAVTKAGIEADPIIKSAISDNPQAQEYFQDLRQSPTGSGKEVADAETNFRKSLSNSIPEALGKSTEDVSADISPSEEGKLQGSKLQKELKNQYEPISKEFNEIKKVTRSIPLDEDVKAQIGENLSKLSQEEKWYVSPSSKIMSELNRAMKEIPNLQTLEDLSSYQTAIGNNTFNPLDPQLSRAGQMMKGVLRDMETNIATKNLQEMAPDLAPRYAAARAQYGQLSKLTDDLQQVLHVPGGNTPGSFIKGLSEMAQKDSETLAKRLSGMNDQYLQQTLKSQFPETAEAVKDYQIRQLLAKASKNVPEGQVLSTKKFFSAWDALPPETRANLSSEEGIQKLESVRTLSETLDKIPRNTSNTAPTLMRYLKNLPGSGLAMVGALVGHNPLMGALLGSLITPLGHNAPDAIKLALLKMMGSSQPLEAEGFKSAVQFIEKLTKGETAVNRLTNNFFKVGKEVLPQAVLPTQKEKQKIDEQLADLQQNPQSLLNVGGKTGHYLPSQGSALAEMTARNVNYLNSLRPPTVQKSPFDKKSVPNPIQEARFDHALTIAEQPLSVLSKVKDGTLTSENMKDFVTMYPELHQKISKRLLSSMVDHLSNDGTISYATKTGLSLFAGQPLESSLSPESIQMNQQALQGPLTPMQQKEGAPSARSKHSMGGLEKISQVDQTPLQRHLNQKGQM